MPTFAETVIEICKLLFYKGKTYWMGNLSY